jgi:hypothetical protein
MRRQDKTGREGGREGEREGGKEGGREGGKEGGREGGEKEALELPEAYRERKSLQHYTILTTWIHPKQSIFSSIKI